MYAKIILILTIIIIDTWMPRRCLSSRMFAGEL